MVIRFRLFLHLVLCLEIITSRAFDNSVFVTEAVLDLLMNGCIEAQT